MNEDVGKMSVSKPFRWSKPRETAAMKLAEGYTQAEAAKAANVAQRTVERWVADPEFSAEVDRLTHMVGIAMRAERLRIAMRAVRQKTKDGLVLTEKDLLDWLKYAQGETDGVKLDLAALIESS
jgi:hypothetical protein